MEGDRMNSTGQEILYKSKDPSTKLMDFIMELIFL